MSWQVMAFKRWHITTKHERYDLPTDHVANMARYAKSGVNISAQLEEKQAAFSGVGSHLAAHGKLGAQNKEINKMHLAALKHTLGE